MDLAAIGEGVRYNAIIMLLSSIILNYFISYKAVEDAVICTYFGLFFLFLYLIINLTCALSFLH